MLRVGAEGRRLPRWSERILAVCWLQWRWRNAEVFEGARLDLQQRLRRVVACFEEDQAVYNTEEAEAVTL